MAGRFRESMLWVHTWVGVVLGGFLFFIFWMGTLAVFDQEIDRWMMPMTRLSPAQAHYSADEAWRQTWGAASKDWQIYPPTERTPVAIVEVAREEIRREGLLPGQAESNAIKEFHYIDPSTGAQLPDPGTLGGQGFFFPLHWNLLITTNDAGIWIVGAAGMAMLLLIVSGVFVHRQIFANFFTLRAHKKSGRVLLDLHNVLGVLGLPFHFVITFSGLAIWFYLYFPAAWQMAYGGSHSAFYEETRARFRRPAIEAPGEIASLDAMIAKAEETWGAGKAEFVHVWHPADANAFVEIYRSYATDIPLDPRVIYFDGATGEILHYDFVRPIAKVQRFIAGLHFIRFRHWTLRWIYFVLGLTGCALIATGALFWLESRRKLHAGGSSPSIRVVEGLTIGAVTGVVLATAAFLIANRVLPLHVENRARIEVWAFFLVWAATFLHAWLRPSRAWSEQCWAIAVAGATAFVLNWITTGDHLVRTVSEANWPVAGVDCALLTGSAVAIWTALALGRSPAGRRIDREPHESAARGA
ncbi:MAG: PepSY domain-containing protein [Hyphomonadaceae bacterium]|nr:PepSY domain-containing protein [Hyphomonadaceae bacterium]